QVVAPRENAAPVTARLSIGASYAVGFVKVIVAIESLATSTVPKSCAAPTTWPTPASGGASALGVSVTSASPVSRRLSPHPATPSMTRAVSRQRVMTNYDQTRAN